MSMTLSLAMSFNKSDFLAYISPIAPEYITPLHVFLVLCFETETGTVNMVQSYDGSKREFPTDRQI